MAPTFTLKLGSLDLSPYTRVNPDDRMDPYSAHFEEPAFTDTPFADGQALTSTTIQNREQLWPLFLRDATAPTKDALHALIRLINNAAKQRPLVLEWRDDGASASTFYDVQFCRFEPDFNFRRSQHSYGAGTLHVWVSGYGHTGTTRVTATAAATVPGIIMSVPIGSVAGDAPALMTALVTAGTVVPARSRLIAVAPIVQPSYVTRIPAASLTNLIAGASLQARSDTEGSQMLSFPGGGTLCQVPLPNPTIAGGDNRILAFVECAGAGSGVAMSALDPFGNTMGGTAIATTGAGAANGFSLVDLGVCRLPTVGYPTQPKLSIVAGSGLWLGAVLCLPDKSLTLIAEGSQSNLAAGDSYLIDGVSADSYRTASSGVFGGQKLVGVQRGAFPKMLPSTTSVAVICAPYDKGRTDTMSAVISVRERFSYAQ